MRTLTADLLVLGAGVAGVYGALAAEARGARVLLLSKDPLPSGSTPWAQGGVAFPLDEADLEAHLQDTLRAGRGLVEEGVARSILEEAPRHLERLLAWGLPFHPEPTREGGHSRPRVRHLGGDRSGLLLLQGLLARLRGPVLEGHLAASLLVAGGRVAGAYVLSPQGPLWVRSGAVLLATGGLGRLFPVTTNPLGATGDGMVLAWRAGAALRDLEFVQFHPTALPDGSLVSEACRGEGAVLRNARGERFMPRYDPQGELAPRDVVARAVFAERQATGGVYLDLRPIPRLEERFPSVVAQARALGLDPLREPLPVAPAAHYAMGGVRTDPRGFTGLPGLFAAGEVASSGLHGANRLASNSLLEGLVLGERAALAALEDLAFPLGAEPLPAPLLDPGLLPALRARMGEAAGVVRRGEGLREALAWVQGLPLEEGLPGALEARPRLEAGHLALLARLLLEMALLREESRGAHFRQDFPEPGLEAYHLEAQGASLRKVPVGV
ncbi:MAG: FAD-binding protein [Thermus sp.]|uniref:L-aspartate oxidase n=1 Tax=Thermus sp. TaxID=275 RepID=UPI0025D49D5B|nr:FAD-binding protein [Thermus sp.]MCS6867835.1 FAD-binding protein [Thermus sp.]MCS7219468.1 FAD-binding protein [Thermus sp.]MCX7849995.1 FAD-binding protein [Thermus sp.]MDW8018096.1 FAD-binding protein [Thermus sp.]MDW8358323.1 FAD-binding protein [Thermus sp.]